MGIAIIGGMVIGTLLTLYVIPAIYTYLTRETTRTPAAVDEPKLEATEA
nr:hypothetical protein [Rhodothermus marinus]